MSHKTICSYAENQESESPVAKAFFETSAGRRTAVGLTLAGTASYLFGLVTGNPGLTFSGCLLTVPSLCTAMIPALKLKPLQKQLRVVFSALGLGTLMSGLAYYGVSQNNQNTAHLANVPEVDGSQQMVVTRKDFECHNLPKGRIVRFSDGTKLTCD